MIVNLVKKFFVIIFLSPISFLWSLIYRIRRSLYTFGYFKSNSFQVPIISIGNLTFGGTGKTPFTLWLGSYLGQQGKKVMILTRGYKGALENDSGILHSEKRLGFNPFEYGDEATMLIRRLKNATVVVGKRRSENLEYYFDKESPDVVLLDDGHQHLKLKRDLNIVLFDSLLPLDRYQVAPVGYLREGLSALNDADIVILGRADQATDFQIASLQELLQSKLTKNIPFVKMSYVPTAFQNSSYEEVFELEDIKGKKVICLAGVASPNSFFDMAARQGANIIDKVTFPDHHSFSKDDIDDVLQKARKEDAYILTTEKDIVKIRRIIEDPRIIHMEIKVNFLSGEKELFDLLK